VPNFRWGERQRPCHRRALPFPIFSFWSYVLARESTKKDQHDEQVTDRINAPRRRNTQLRPPGRRRRGFRNWPGIPLRLHFAPDWTPAQPSRVTLPAFIQASTAAPIAPPPEGKSGGAKSEPPRSCPLYPRKQTASPSATRSRDRLAHSNTSSARPSSGSGSVTDTDTAGGSNSGCGASAVGSLVFESALNVPFGS